MIGCVDMGGGTRGIYGAGVLDGCLDLGIHFDGMYAVSAGSANAVSYMAGQRGRNYRFYTSYFSRAQTMGPRTALHTRNLLDLDYIYCAISAQDGEDPLDYDTFQANPARLEVVTTDARSGKSVYFHKDDISLDHYECLCASSTLPLVNRPYIYKGRAYFDGGVSDPIPLHRALEDGCDRVVVILTRSKNLPGVSRYQRSQARLLRRRYPGTADAILNRCRLYDEALALARSLEESGKVLILSPEELPLMRTLTRNRESLDLLYQAGLDAAQRIPAFLNRT